MTGQPTRTGIGLYAKLAEVIVEVKGVPKDGRNAFHNYDYTTAEALLGVIRGPLARRGVLIMPSLTAMSEREYESAKGKASTITTAHVRFTLVDGESGERHDCDWAGQGDDPADKGLAKAFTNAIKTFLREQFLVPQGGNDPEDDQRTDERANERAPARHAPTTSGGGERPLLPLDEARQLLDMIGEAGVSSRWLRMQLVDLGVDDVPAQVTGGTLRQLSPDQAGRLRSLLGGDAVAS